MKNESILLRDVAEMYLLQQRRRLYIWLQISVSVLLYHKICKSERRRSLCLPLYCTVLCVFSLGLAQATYNLIQQILKQIPTQDSYAVLYSRPNQVLKTTQEDCLLWRQLLKSNAQETILLLILAFWHCIWDCNFIKEWFCDKKIFWNTLLFWPDGLKSEKHEFPEF